MSDAIQLDTDKTSDAEAAKKPHGSKDVTPDEDSGQTPSSAYGTQSGSGTAEDDTRDPTPGEGSTAQSEESDAQRDESPDSGFKNILASEIQSGTDGQTAGQTCDDDTELDPLIRPKQSVSFQERGDPVPGILPRPSYPSCNIKPHIKPLPLPPYPPPLPPSDSPSPEVASLAIEAVGAGGGSQQSGSSQDLDQYAERAVQAVQALNQLAAQQQPQQQPQQGDVDCLKLCEWFWCPDTTIGKLICLIGTCLCIALLICMYVWFLATKDRDGPKRNYFDLSHNVRV